MITISKIDKFLKKLELVLLLLSFLLILLANYLIFMLVPSEQVMGAVQRILYFHAGSAIACYIAFGIVFVASILYLAKKNKIFDALNVSAAEVGFLFCTIVLISGMIWGKAAWGTWFRMEPRLVTFLLLWLIFLTFNVLRLFSFQQSVANHTAIIGIVGAVTVPIMVYSIKLLPSYKQLHPEVIEKAGLPPVMLYTLFLTIFALVIFLFLLITMRFRLEIKKYGNS